LVFLIQMYYSLAVPFCVPKQSTILFSDADPWWTVCLAMVGKFQIAASFAVIYVYAGELMPTVVRSQVRLH
jgi:hypothetical protein